jgi:hypothetical protein
MNTKEFNDGVLTLREEFYYMCKRDCIQSDNILTASKFPSRSP